MSRGGVTTRRRALLLAGFITGIGIVAMVAAYIQGASEPPVETPSPLGPATPLVSAIDSATCEDRPLGAQYAMVCADSQLLNTDDPDACEGFGGPYQIIVCPDPSQSAASDTRPTLAGGGGSMIMPAPETMTTTGSLDLTPTVGPAGGPTLVPTGLVSGEPSPTSPAQPGAPEAPPTPVPDTPVPTQPPAVATPAPLPTLSPATPLPTNPPTPATPPAGTLTATATLAANAPAPTATMTPTAQAAPTMTPTIGASPTPTGPMALPPIGVVFTGTGQHTTPSFILTATRLVLVRLAYNGVGNVTLSLRPAASSSGPQLLQAIGLAETSSVADVPAEGAYVIDVSPTSTGMWAIHVSQPFAPADTPFTSPNVPLTGKGDQATGFVRLARKVTTMDFQHAGTGIFIVTLYDAETGRMVRAPLVQVQGQNPGSATISIEREGIYIFDVVASDTWSIRIQ